MHVSRVEESVQVCAGSPEPCLLESALCTKHAKSHVLARLSLGTAIADVRRTMYYSKTCLKRPLKKYCRMLQGEGGAGNSAILSTFISYIFPLRPLFSFYFKWPLKTGFTVFPSSFVFVKITDITVEMRSLMFFELTD